MFLLTLGEFNIFFLTVGGGLFTEFVIETLHQ